MYDFVEWAAQQPWSNGNVGMIGINYFAGTQMEAAVERPAHLKAIMPIAATFDLYESATHHGLMRSGFVTPFLFMIGMTSGHTNKLWRSKLMDAMRALLLTRYSQEVRNGQWRSRNRWPQSPAQAASRSPSLGRSLARYRRGAPFSRRLVGGPQPASITRSRRGPSDAKEQARGYAENLKAPS
jgi:predicted acyl esterase